MHTHGLVILWLLCCSVEIAMGCSASPIEFRLAASDIRIVVTHREAPISGIRVEVVPEAQNKPIFENITDEQGLVLIQGLLPGKYRVEASHLNFLAEEWIEVKTSPDEKAVKQFRSPMG